MENEHELGNETLTRVYVGSYEHYKGVVAEVEDPEPRTKEAYQSDLGHMVKLEDDVVELKVSKKNNVSTSGNKKKDVEPTKETATLADDEGIPLTRVDPSGKHDSDDEVASVDNDMANFLAPKDVSYGTNSLLEQWKESYRNREYDYDPYDDDMYEG
ncbi:hypothetical protein Tco_1288394 [Tanacetum coccineum]